MKKLFAGVLELAQRLVSKTSGPQKGLASSNLAPGTMPLDQPLSLMIARCCVQCRFTDFHAKEWLKCKARGKVYTYERPSINADGDYDLWDTYSCELQVPPGAVSAHEEAEWRFLHPEASERITGKF